MASQQPATLRPASLTAQTSASSAVARRDLCSRVVARYLQEHGFEGTLGVFLHEAGIELSDDEGDEGEDMNVVDADSVGDGTTNPLKGVSRTSRKAPSTKTKTPDLRTLVEDYNASVIASRLVSTHLVSSSSKEGALPGRGVPLKSKEEVLADLMAIRMPSDPARIGLQKVERSIGGISNGNLLGVGVGRIPKRRFDTAEAVYRSSYHDRILVTAIDKSLKTVDPISGDVDQLFQPHSAAILCFAQHPTQSRYLLTGSMDGTIQTFKSAKFVVKCCFSADGRWFATASYDRNIFIYEAKPESVITRADHDILDAGDDPILAREPSLRYEERHRIETRTNPEAIAFHPEGSYLIYSVRSSHLLHYVSLPMETQETAHAFVRTSKSFNAHPLDDHVSFSVLNIAIAPSGKMIACQTGDHASHGGERILIYGVDPDESGKERLACIWTGESGDEYVLPRMAWLPDGSGIITTTTTGHLTLLDLSGKIRSKLKVHGGLVNGSLASEVIRDVAVVPDPHSPAGWKAISVGYDTQLRIST